MMRTFFKVFFKIIFGLVVVGILIVGYIKFFLPNIKADQTLNIEKTTARIDRGKYLANHVAICMDCHSKRDWTSYAGPMQESGIGGGGEVFTREMGFPGIIYSRNITPFGLGNWSDGEILRAISSGINKDGKALFPLMNYHRFGQMGKEDIFSIIAYIRTLKPLKTQIPDAQFDFPVNILINTFPTEPNYQEIPKQSDLKSYGKYLANAAGCVDCHSKNDKGNVIPGTEFGGGLVFSQPGGSVTSPNLTPHLENGIGYWTKELFIQRFKLYAAADYKPAKMADTDLNTPMPWNMYAGMTEDDLSAIFSYLKSLEPINNQVTVFNKN